MALLTTAPLKRALVKRLTSNATLAAIRQKGGIHQRLAPRRVAYPFIVYSEVSAPWSIDAGGAGNLGHATVDAIYDISAISLNPVEAENLDSIIANLLSGSTADHDLEQYLSGQRCLRCQRVATMPTGPERDNEGRYIVQFGGSYRIIVDQPITA